MTGRLGLVAAALVLAFPAAARADVYDDNPAAVTFGGAVYVFAFNRADNQIIERHTSGGTWTAWAPVPGLKAGSGASALAYGSKLLLFARGQNGEAWQNELVNGSWSGWISLGGGLSSAPAAGLRVGTNTVDLAVRGTDDALHHRFYTPDGGWSPWARVGGHIGSAPTLLGFNPAQTMDVFVRNGDGTIVGLYLNPPNTWSPWFDHGGRTNAAPTSVHTRPHRVEIYVRGTNNWLYHQQHAIGATSWSPVDPAPLDSGPAATADRPGHVLIFARIGDDLHVKEANVPDAGLPTYGPWVSLGPIGLPGQQQPPGNGPVTVVQRPERLTPSISFTYYRPGRRRTRFKRLVVKRVPVGATVRVTCARGCSAKRLTVVQRRPRVISLRRLIRRPIPVGRKLVVIVTKPGTIGSHKTITIRRRREPSITTRCLPPGAARPQRCG